MNTTEVHTKMSRLVTSLFLSAWVCLLALEQSAHGAARPIPRTPSQEFKTEGLFEGGTPKQSANLEAVRFEDEPGVERWVIAFSKPGDRKAVEIAPRFQLRYIPGDQIIGSTGELILDKSPKFILSFRSIRRNFLKREQLQQLVQRSSLVKSIVVYPPVEDGDTAVELVLSKNVLFSPHQPASQQGQLILDLKELPPEPASQP